MGGIHYKLTSETKALNESHVCVCVWTLISYSGQQGWGGGGTRNEKGTRNGERGWECSACSRFCRWKGKLANILKGHRGGGLELHRGFCFAFGISPVTSETQISLENDVTLARVYRLQIISKLFRAELYPISIANNNNFLSYILKLSHQIRFNCPTRQKF